MRDLSRDLFVVVAIAATVFFLRLGGPVLWDRDEPRNAGCAYEMLERNDWIVPTFNAELRTHKPILLYWFTMAAYAIFGVNEFAARFPSALLAVGTVVCTYLISLRLQGRRVAFWSANALATMLMFDVAGRAATPDSVLIFPCTLATLIFVWGTYAGIRSDDSPGAGPRLLQEGRYFPTSIYLVIAMYAAMGVAVLAKGPVGLVMPTAVIGMFLLIKRLPVADQPLPSTRRARLRRWIGRLLRPFGPLRFFGTCRTMRPLIAIGVVALVALPWYVWVHLRTDGAWTRGFFLEHNLSRATTAMENHGGPIYYYPVAILVGTFPWSVFAVPLLIDLVRTVRRRDADQDASILGVCWIGVYLAIFSLARTKLPSYITPCYPGVAILVGGFMGRWLNRQERVASFWPYVSLAVFGCIGIGMAIGLPIAAIEFVASEAWLGIVAGLIPAVGAAAAFYFLRRDHRMPAGMSFAAAAVAFSVMLFAIGAARVGRYQPSRALVDVSSFSDSPVFASIGQLDPTWVFYARRPVTQISEETVAGYLESGPDAFLITNDQTYAQIESQLPAGTKIIRRLPQFMRSGELLLIRSDASFATRSDSVRR